MCFRRSFIQEPSPLEEYFCVLDQLHLSLSILFEPSSPLFSSGFSKINLSSLSVYRIFNFLEQFDLPPSTLLSLYTAINGVIGNYEEMFKVMFLFFN